MPRVLIVGDAPTADLRSTLRGSRWTPILALPGELESSDVRVPSADCRRVALPQTDAPDFDHTLVAVLKRLRIAAVVPTDAASSLRIAALRDQLLPLGVVTVSPSLDVVRRCDDRLRLHRSLRSIVPTGRVELWDGLTNLPFPAMIRPRYASEAGQGRPSAACGTIALREFCAEAIGPGAGIRVDVATDVTGGIRYIRATSLGSAPRGAAQDLRVRAWVESTVAHLRLRGVATLFLRGDRDGRPLVMDVRPFLTPDPAGAMALREALTHFAPTPTRPTSASIDLRPALHAA